MASIEILDHSKQRTILSSFLEYEGDILYVILDDRRGRTSTQVKLVRNNEQPMNILGEELRYEAKSKWFLDSKNELRLFLYNLVNLPIDDFSNDIIEVRKINGEYISKRINHPFIDASLEVNGVALDSRDRVYTKSYDSGVRMFENDTLVGEIFIDFAESSLLHNNHLGEVFIIDSEKDSIYKVNDLELEFVSEITENIRALKTVDNTNWGLTNEGKLIKFQSDFSTIINEYELPFGLNSLDQITVNNSKVYVMETLINGFKIYEFNSGSLTLLIEQEEDFATSTKLHALSDSVFLTSGQFEIEDIANHAFVRTYHMNHEFLPVRQNILLSDFELYYLKDTIITGAPWDLWKYGINYNLENKGINESDLNCIYTNDLVPQFTSGETLFSEHVKQNIKANEKINIESSMLIAYEHPSSGRAAVTGSDYKFNESFSPINIGITTSIDDLSPIQETRVFPNPFNSQLFIDVESKQDVFIYSSDGRLMKRTDTDLIRSQNFDGLIDGTYFLKLENEDNLISVIKMNDRR